MATTAAHFVDNVVPRVAVRQVVLTLPWRRRWLLARRPDLARGVLGVLHRAVFAWQGQRAGRPGGAGGAVTVQQRFGSALNLNVHFHALVLDGVYDHCPRTERVRFWRSGRVSTAEVESLVVTVAERVEAWLTRRGFGPDGEEPEPPDVEDGQVVIQAAAVAGRSASARGRRARRTQTHGGRAYQLPPKCASYGGYNIHAGVVIGAKDREGLERLCRYVARPALCQERLRALPKGEVELQLKRAWADGTSSLRMTELEFVERVAALVAPPRSNDIHYHGVLAPRHRWRRQVVPARRKREGPAALLLKRSKKSSLTSTWMPWSTLLARVFDKNGFACPKCGEPMSVRAVVLAPGASHVVAGLEAAQARGSPGGGPTIVST
jgi:hypothetical protein